MPVDLAVETNPHGALVLAIGIGEALCQIVVLAMLPRIVAHMPGGFVDHGAKAALGRQSVNVTEVGFDLLSVRFWESKDCLLHCIDLTFLGRVEIDGSEESALSEVLLEQTVWRLPEEAAERVGAAHGRSPAVKSSASVATRKCRGTLFVKRARLALRNGHATQRKQPILGTACLRGGLGRRGGLFGLLCHHSIPTVLDSLEQRQSNYSSTRCRLA